MGGSHSPRDCEKSGLIVYAKRFFSGTLLSRVSGLGRDLAMAFAFGDHPSVAAFLVAFRLSNLFRRLLGDGPLQSAFIPYFEQLRVQDPLKALFFFRKLITLVTAVLLVLILLGEGTIAAMLSSGYLSPGTKEITELTGWLFPGILFICLYGCNSSLLHCYDSFFIPCVAPLICNGIWIVAALLLRDTDPAFAMTSLTHWVMIGFFGQWLLTMPLTWKHISAPWKEWFHFSIPPEVITLIKAFSLGAIGVGAVQINAFVDTVFARYADIRGPIYLWYSIRLEHLALAVFGIACISTITPRLSRAIKNGHLDSAKDLFSLAYSRVLIILIPCTFAIFALGQRAVDLIYGRGHFSEIAVSKTAYCLYAYGWGLIPSALIILFSSIFYAKGNFRIPLWISLISVASNLFLNTLFVFGLNLGAVSIALATSLSAWINCLILLNLLARMGWRTEVPLSRILSLSSASVFAVLTTIASEYFFCGNEGILAFSAGLSSKIAYFSINGITFCLGFVVYVLIFRVDEVVNFLRDIFVSMKDSSPLNLEGG